MTVSERPRMTAVERVLMGARSGMEVSREENGMDKVSDTFEHLKNINIEY